MSSYQIAGMLLIIIGLALIFTGWQMVKLGSIQEERLRAIEALAFGLSR